MTDQPTRYEQASEAAYAWAQTIATHGTGDTYTVDIDVIRPGDDEPIPMEVPLAAARVLHDMLGDAIRSPLRHMAAGWWPKEQTAPAVDRQTAAVLSGLHRSAADTVTRCIDVAERWRPRCLPHSQAHRLLTELRAAILGEQPAAEKPDGLRATVAAALREHGMVHLGPDAPDDEYECCAEVALDAAAAATPSPKDPQRPDDDGLRAEIRRVLTTTPSATGRRVPDPRPWQEHGTGHRYSGACALCTGDVDALVNGVVHALPIPLAQPAASDELRAAVTEALREHIHLADEYDCCAEAAIEVVTARGYCPHCGRGDCAPTVGQWEHQRDRAERAEAAIKGAQDAVALHRKQLLTTAELYAVIEAALDQPKETRP